MRRQGGGISIRSLRINGSVAFVALLCVFGVFVRPARGQQGDAEALRVAASNGVPAPADLTDSGTTGSESSANPFPATRSTVSDTVDGGQAAGRTSRCCTSGGDDEWHVSWYPIYLWAISFSGTVGAPGGRSLAGNANFGDLLSKLNFAWMTEGEVRKGRFGLINDFVYGNLSNNFTTRLGGSGHARSELVLYQPDLTIRIARTESSSLDFVAGMRLTHIGNTLNYNSSEGLAAFTLSGGKTYADFVVGGRARLALPKGFYAPVYADIGGFGSQLSYQVLAGIGRELKHKYPMFIGYRRLTENYTNAAPFAFQATLNGVVLGVGIQFK